MIYFVQGALTRLIKIGRAIDCQRRLKELQTGSPDRLHLLKEIYADDELELILHRRFKRNLSHGEWYFPGKPLLALINSLPSLTVTAPQLVTLLDSLGVEDDLGEVDKEKHRRDAMGPGTGLQTYGYNTRFRSYGLRGTK